ncbi:unnamed protein product [Cyprideis torosa]|uniref:Uncharacterized protein n=1 Tax=Cyprideis torosa TaxID=163714 RepID=A0A7R8W2I2_9CRUS|nr:unnamed protein product [Cyprideis torosa]CAG0881975.1 unnamed protein product [Cyprideis torosa]
MGFGQPGLNWRETQRHPVPTWRNLVFGPLLARPMGFYTLFIDWLLEVHRLVLPVICIEAPNLGVSHHLSKQYGRCYTIFQLPDLESPPELGQDKGLMVVLETNTSEYREQNPEYSGWSVFVHPVQEKWTEFSELGDTILETIHINLGEEVTLRLAVSEYKTVNNPPKDTCIENETFSVIEQYGRCYTIFQLPDLESPPELGQDKGLMVVLETNTSEYREQNPEYSGWSVFVHPVQEKWTEFSELGDTILETIQINLGEEVTLRLAVSEYKTVNNPPKDTCIEDETFSVIECRERCFYEYLDTLVPCRGPWVQNSSLEICSNAADMEKFLYEESRVLRTISNRCDCTRQCKFRRYSMAAMDRKDSQAPFGGLQRGKIELYYPSGLAHQVIESWGYDGSQFIGEVGGSLGLLLGMSVLSFLEILENISRVMWAKLCWKKKRDPKEVVG